MALVMTGMEFIWQGFAYGIFVGLVLAVFR
jgi:hypothetical protein